MTYYDYVPEATDESWLPEGDDIEDYLSELFLSIAIHERDRRKNHDRDSFFAEFAYDDKCRALGHEPELDEDGEVIEPWDDTLSMDGIHVSGWDGDMICLETKYGSACSYCEGICEYDVPPVLWSLPGVLV